jgi:lysosomal Pro-X carboxypeptidase
MWDNAPEYKAALVFVEHRYYGKSLPFGNESFSSLKNLGYLSAEQALADFAEVITYLKNEVGSFLLIFSQSY